MRRTEGRPLPAKKLTPRAALLFGIGLAAIGFAGLALFVNLLSGLLGLFTLSAYLFVYTPLKQRTSLSTVVGRCPSGAATDRLRRRQRTSQPAGLVAVRHPVPLAVSALPGHRLDVREDYARPASSCFPVVEPDGESTSRQIVAYASLDSNQSASHAARHDGSRLSCRSASAGGWFFPRAFALPSTAPW